LLRAVDELRAMEREKRRLAISSRTFQELAERVEQKAREVFRLAGQEDDDGRTVQGRTASDPLGDQAIDRTQPTERTPNAPGEGGRPDPA
jgi:hypothetical protein